MKLSISNIAFQEEEAEIVYQRMGELGFSGLEIAPTRWFPEAPYTRLAEAARKAEALKEQFGFSISSMQSIWFQRTERLFGRLEERRALLAYTRQAIDFARAVHCPNLVLGCPRNRNVPEEGNREAGPAFLRECGEYALQRGAVLAIEPNPPIYHTNYINRTQEAFSLAQQVDHPGFRVNVDMGTMLYYGESVSLIEAHLPLVSHVHLSEPNLVRPRHLSLARDMMEMLRQNGYGGYLSIEMGSACELSEVMETLEAVAALSKEVRPS